MRHLDWLILGVLFNILLKLTFATPPKSWMDIGEGLMFLILSYGCLIIWATSGFRNREK